MRDVNVAVLGCGNVGSAFVELLERERSRIAERFGLSLNLTRVLVRDLDKERPVAAHLVTRSAIDAIDTDCDIVVELIGGIHSAGAFVRRAIARGRHVVTANKALLAAHGGELFETARAKEVTIGFEASVCGAVPVVAALQRSLASDEVQSIRGVVNGTCNFILCRMEDGVAFGDAVALAQGRGFAEADPTLDVSGEDAAQKLRVLSAIAFDAPVVEERIVGITGVTPEAIQRARFGGCVVRLVAVAERTPSGVKLTVEPRELDANDLLASVHDEENAVVIRSRAAGELTLTGKGAGAMPTAVSVLADVLEIARERPAAPRRDMNREVLRRVIGRGDEMPVVLQREAAV